MGLGITYLNLDKNFNKLKYGGFFVNISPLKQKIPITFFDFNILQNFNIYKIDKTFLPYLNESLC